MINDNAISIKYNYKIYKYIKLMHDFIILTISYSTITHTLILIHTRISMNSNCAIQHKLIIIIYFFNSNCKTTCIK